MAAHKILILQKDIDESQDLKKSLESLGYEVSGIAESEAVANKMIKNIMPDLVMIRIDEEEGTKDIKTAEAIRKEFNIPIIFIGGALKGNLMEEALKTDPFGYILKPYNGAILKPVIETALLRYEKEKELMAGIELQKKINGNPEMICSFKPDGTITYVNRAYCVFTGKSSEELIGSNIYEIEKRQKPSFSTSDEQLEYLKDRYKPRHNIKTVTKMTGIEPNVIRQYEKAGLLKPWRDPDNNYRYFTDDEVEWITRIKKLIHEENLNIKGIISILTIEPCWIDRSCPMETRIKCSAYKNRNFPCWHMKDEPECCKSKKCYRCRYYVENKNHPKLMTK